MSERERDKNAFFRIDISHILSFYFNSFKRTSTILLSPILFSAHLFICNVFSLAPDLKLQRIGFLFILSLFRSRFDRLAQKSVFCCATTIYMHMLLLCDAVWVSDCHCFDHVAFLLVFVDVDDDNDNGRHRQFDCFQFCSVWRFFFSFLFSLSLCVCHILLLLLLSLPFSLVCYIANSNCNPKTLSFICSVCAFSTFCCLKCFVVVAATATAVYTYIYMFFIRFLSFTSFICAAQW